jgi:hypothetical protein
MHTTTSTNTTSGYLNLRTGRIQEHCTVPDGFIAAANSDGTITVGCHDHGTVRLSARQATAFVRATYKVMKRIHYGASVTELIVPNPNTYVLAIERYGSSFTINISTHGTYRSEKKTKIIRAHELRDFVSALIGCIESAQRCGETLH